MTGLRLAEENVGFALFSTQCVFALLQRQKSWDRAACGEEEHTRGKKGKTMGGEKGEDRDGDCWREGKSRFCSFPRRKSWDRAHSTGCTCLLSRTRHQDCVGSTQKKNCRKHTEGEHSNAIVTVQCSPVVPFMYHIYNIYSPYTNTKYI